MATKHIFHRQSAGFVDPAVTGWLGFATTTNKNGTFLRLLPVNVDAQVALFSDAWDQVKPGTSLVGLAGGIKQRVKFRRSQEEPFGCQNNKGAALLKRQSLD